MHRFPRPKRHRRPRPFLPNPGAPTGDDFETSVDPLPELEDWMTGGPGGK